MKSKSASKNLLREIRIQAKRLKSGKKRVKSYPPAFRALVVDAVSAGFAVPKVAKAGGVSSNAVYSWKKAAGSTVKKLRVTVGDKKQMSKRPSIKIFIGSRARLELPAESLTTALISKLAALE